MTSTQAEHGRRSQQGQWMEKVKVSIASSRAIRGGNYVQLATVDETGQPHCRTIVFRGFVALPSGGLALKMITDARSDKVSQIQHNRSCEMVWWFSQTSEQYRIAGHLELVAADSTSPWAVAARSEQWNALSDTAKQQFFWSKPGMYDPLVASSVANEGGHGLPPATFLLVLLQPSIVKYLRLSDNATLHEAFLPDGTWERRSSIQY
ncbi:hypothetical protein B5M09_013567 [Aphanomyces astaci]|nr:hypothetical protein B5M09_013567 [Aphanomyces astaci]